MVYGMHFNIQQAIDFGFMGIVLFTCWQTLFGSGRESRSAKWREELGRVEEVLRELIAEASAAGSNLDRSLNHRKSELQQLIKTIELAKQGVSGEIPAAAGRGRGSRRANQDTRQSPAAEDVPNESWLSAPRYMLEDEAPSADEGELVDQLEMSRDLMEAAELQRDSVRLSGAAQQRTARGGARSSAAAIKAALKDSLAARVERMTARTEESVERGFVGESMDPVAYKIARRLLLGGKEIHVVARKLEIPVAEVRIIERMLRDSGELQEPAPQEDGAHIVRARAAQARSLAPVIPSEKAEAVADEELGVKESALRPVRIVRRQAEDGVEIERNSALL